MKRLILHKKVENDGVNEEDGKKNIEKKNQKKSMIQLDIDFLSDFTEIFDCLDTEDLEDLIEEKDDLRLNSDDLPKLDFLMELQEEDDDEFDQIIQKNENKSQSMNLENEFDDNEDYEDGDINDGDDGLENLTQGLMDDLNEFAKDSSNNKHSFILIIFSIFF
ncbi:hypothetical protein M0813_22563 [Anaeramoeba flamelloides]|uniref:Uncharacterized protein n=1 Tax=Anaeramoeba flamelloides TaxID=1746091 RepID=A0ABQ8YD14_9EUKA|nr:hypothetical protein M0813_22563 [Anaeramoeba flamelloides]